MWLKKLVGLSMIITLIGMNTIVLIGFFSKDKNTSFSLNQSVTVTPPVVELKADPTEVPAGMFSALSWTVTGEIEGCAATGDWTGPKTQFGSESTGRLPAEGKKTYTLTCHNKGGTTAANVEVNVVAATSTSTTSSSSNSTATNTTKAVVYCNGATPCYGPREVASHGSAGNCWGYNGDWVFNITSLDAGFHRGKSAISSIEVGGVCGKNLAPSLAGSVSAGDQTRDHNASTKANADRNMIPYRVGYFDTKKP